MAAYLGRRLMQSLLILLGITLVTFLLLYVLPADPARQIAGRSATAATVESIRHQLGLDQPFYLQYWRYLTQPRAGRPRPLLPAEDRGLDADRIAAAGDASSHGRRHHLRARARPDDGHDRGAEARARRPTRS